MTISNRSVRSRVRTAAVLAASALASSACIDDPTAPEEGEILALSADEARVLGLSVVNQAFDIQVSSSAGPSGQDGDFSGFERVEIECAEGGTIQSDLTVSGTTDSETGVLTYGYSIVKRHRACRFSEDGLRVELDGRPSITTTFEFVLDPAASGRLDFSGRYFGSVRIESGGEAAVCAIDVDVVGTITADEAEPTQTITGTVCDVPVDETG